MINVYYVSRTVFYTVWIAFICQTWNVNELHRRCISAFSEQVAWRYYILGKCRSYRTRIWKFQKGNIIEIQFYVHPVLLNPICRESRTFNGDNKSVETRISLFIFYFINIANELYSLYDLISKENLRFYARDFVCTCIHTCTRVFATSRNRYVTRTTSVTLRLVLRTTPTARTRKLNALPEHRALLVTCTSLLSSLCAAFTTDIWSLYNGLSTVRTYETHLRTL